MNGSEPLLKDISVTLNADTPEWPGDTPFTCGWSSLMGAGASVNVSLFTSSPHVGTHADAPLPVHNTIFSANGAILENLDLRRVTPTMYELMAFPLKLMALDAAPVRAVLRQIVA